MRIIPRKRHLWIKEINGVLILIRRCYFCKHSLNETRQFLSHQSLEHSHQYSSLPQSWSEKLSKVARTFVRHLYTSTVLYSAHVRIPTRFHQQMIWFQILGSSSLFHLITTRDKREESGLIERQQVYSPVH